MRNVPGGDSCRALAQRLPNEEEPPEAESATRGQSVAGEHLVELADQVDDLLGAFGIGDALVPVGAPAARPDDVQDVDGEQPVVRLRYPPLKVLRSAVDSPAVARMAATVSSSRPVNHDASVLHQVRLGLDRVARTICAYSNRFMVRR